MHSRQRKYCQPQRITQTDLIRSRRQYIHQFEKWGWQKYSKGKAAPSSNSKSKAATSTDVMSSMMEVDPVSSPHGAEKRAAQTQSLRTIQSTLSKPLVPPKKKAKLDESPTSRDPYAGLAEALDTGFPQSTCPTTENLLSTQSNVMIPGAEDITMENAPPVDSLGQEKKDPVPNENETRSLGVVHDGEQNEPPFDDSYATEYDQGSWESFSIFENESQVDIDNEEFPLAKTWREPMKVQQAKDQVVDPSRPIHSYTENDIGSMMLAADYLFCSLSEEDAFPIYSIVLQWFKSNKTPRWAEVELTIACARCPSNTDQCEIAKSFLGPRADDENFSAADRFVARMLLAESYYRTSKDEVANAHVEQAMAFAEEHDILSSLSPTDRTLDLLVFHNLTRCYRFGDSDNIAASVPHYMDKPDAKQYVWSCTQDILYRVPGPFEMRWEFMRNPCLRSCLEWCREQLKDISKMPGLWKELKKDHTSLRWAQRLALFDNLWHSWQTGSDLAISASSEVWKGEAARLMGISPTELLLTTCGIINEASTLTLSNDELERITDLRTAADALMEHSDEDLAILFLETYTSGNRIRNLAPEDVAFRSVVRETARSLIQRVLMISFPDISASISRGINRSQQSLHSLTARLRAARTIASSLRSSDWSSFREAYTRMQKDTAKAARRMKHTAPSLLHFNRSSTSIDANWLGKALAASLQISDMSRDSRSSARAGTSGYEMGSVLGASMRKRISSHRDDASSQQPLIVQ
jgi:hypothetical protein